MNKFKIKICGVKDKEIIKCCYDNKVDYFGIIFYEKSPRYINLKLAIDLINYAKKYKIIPVGVFVNKKIDDLKKIINQTNLTHVQLHGEEDDDYINNLKEDLNLKIIKSIGINKKDDLKKIYNLKNPDFYLFDYKAKDNELPGGNAKSFEWSILKEVKIEKPWFISGGININNIRKINDNLVPYGIDISSGVEDKPGIKNSKKIIELIEKLNV